MAILAVILVVIIIFLPGGLVDIGKLFRSKKHG
jgi:hypothetical protein